MFALLVLTPDAILVDESVESVMLPAVDGALQVTTGRWPLVTALAVDNVRYGEKWVAIQGGFAVFRGNRLCVLTPDAVVGATDEQLRELRSRESPEPLPLDLLIRDGEVDAP